MHIVVIAFFSSISHFPFLGFFFSAPSFSFQLFFLLLLLYIPSLAVNNFHPSPHSTKQKRIKSEEEENYFHSSFIPFSLKKKKKGIFLRISSVDDRMKTTGDLRPKTNTATFQRVIHRLGFYFFFSPSTGKNLFFFYNENVLSSTHKIK